MRCDHAASRHASFAQGGIYIRRKLPRATRPKPTAINQTPEAKSHCTHGCISFLIARHKESRSNYMYMSFHEWTFVGFTGKRKLPYPDKIKQAIAEALDLIADRTGSPLAAVSSAACDADTLFIEESLKRELPWTLLLPFHEDEFQKDFTAEEWARTKPLLARSVRRVVEHDSEHRDHAFLESGLRTVDESDVVLAVWDGEPGLTGGTGGVIE